MGNGRGGERGEGCCADLEVWVVRTIGYYKLISLEVQGNALAYKRELNLVDFLLLILDNLIYTLADSQATLLIYPKPSHYYRHH